MAQTAKMPMQNGLVLGIETSCDETAAAVVRAGSEVLSNVVASQMAMHAVYGGVVPELASREHLRNIVVVVRAALAEAGVGFNDLDAIAVTEGPGLAGALLVGISYAKALAYGLGKPLIAVNHLEGHIHAVVFAMQADALRAKANPLLALVVSGGHTHLYLARVDSENGGAQGWHYNNVGGTVDDAAGEAYDKVAKLLGLGYPGGPWVDFLAAHGDGGSVKFGITQVKEKVHRENKTAGLSTAPLRGSGRDDNQKEFQFSFSGIKTAVLRYVETHNLRESIDTRRRVLLEMAGAKLGLIASFQRSVVEYLARQTFAAAEHYGARCIVVSGGVAANRELRERFTKSAAERGLTVAFPTLALSTDNAAMIAAAAWPKLQHSVFAGNALAATPQLKLGERRVG